MCLLTQSQIDRFHRDGFLVLPGLFDDGEVDALGRAAEQVRAQALAGSGEGHLFREVEGRPQYYRTNGVWDRHPAFRQATVKPALLAAIGQCLGHPFLPFNDAIVVKQPHSGVDIKWHQDPPYNGLSGSPTTFGVPNFDVDIYLDKADLVTGCLFGLPQHHLVGRLELERFTDDQLFVHPSAVAFEMRPGDVLFHALSAPHGSKPNDGESTRRVFYAHYIAREVLEHCYTNYWNAATGRSWDQRLEFAAKLVAEFEIPAEAAVELTNAGFVFEGTPTTPPNHWETLTARMTPAESDAKRRLVS